LAFDARVLILAAHDARIGQLAAGLDALGWTTVTARDVGSAEATLQDLPLEAAVIDFDSLTPDAAVRLRAAAQPRRLPIMVVGAAPDSVEGADVAMSVPPHPAQAALRLEQLGRAAIAEEEFHLRVATFGLRGISLAADPGAAAPLRILAAGVADRRFLALSNGQSHKPFDWHKVADVQNFE
jgi:two-component system cell cycle response regulator PopA